MIEIQSPRPFGTLVDSFPAHHSVFLGGSIEMGKAEPWQQRMVSDLHGLNIILLNPRRIDWDATWVQSIQNDKFREQVEWELAALDKCDTVVFYFDPATQSPVTLLELGLFATKAIVYCPEGFWRKGNVDIVCKRYGATTVDSYEELLSAVKSKIDKTI